MSYVCPNPTCRKTKCYDHCNHCGEKIFWRPPLLDKEIAYNGPKPLNKDATLHRCMPRGGVKQYKKIYGDPILDNCNASKEFYDFVKRRVIRHSSLSLKVVNKKS